MKLLSDKEFDFFHKNGYLVKRKFVSLDLLEQIKSAVKKDLESRVQPFELEQQVNYPGSPKSLESAGGDTIRRLLLAYSRGRPFQQWAKNEAVLNVLQSLFQSNTIKLVQSHHNCVMTKQPQYSSETHWHKDIRYWSFENNELINTWLPLGDEVIENGCLQVIPKTHQWHVPTHLIDDRLFLRKDLPESSQWIDKAVNVELKKGDLLFFHAATFHAAGKNHTNNSKNALVFTYHCENNAAIENTKSTKYDEIQVSA
jgi:phytanoyl-CoA hydroxylase